MGKIINFYPKKKKTKWRNNVQNNVIIPQKRMSGMNSHIQKIRKIINNS